MKKKVKKTQGKRTRGHTKRQQPQVPIDTPSSAPSWHRPWILTSTNEYDERTVSARPDNEAYYGHKTPRTEEEEEQYNLFLQQELYEKGARDRERAYNHAIAERHQQLEAAKEAERRERIVAKADKKKAKKIADARALAEQEAAARKEAQRVEAASIQLRKQLLEEIEYLPPSILKHVHQPTPSRASYQHARVLFEITNQPKLKPTEHPTTSSQIIKTIEMKQPYLLQAGDKANTIGQRRGPYLLQAGDKANNIGQRRDGTIWDGAPKSRVLTQERVPEDETIEEMVGRIEREMEEELETLFPPVATAIAAAASTKTAAMAAEQRVSEEKELEDLKIQNKIFDSSFLPSATTTAEATAAPSATTTAAATTAPSAAATAAPPETTTSAATTVPLTTSDSIGRKATMPPGTKQQTPPIAEPATKPPPDRDKSRKAYGSQGCLKNQTVSRKGVLDIAYLVSGRGPEYRSRYRYRIKARVREVHPWLARQ
jgi:hypothetical protein